MEIMTSPIPPSQNSSSEKENISTNPHPIWLTLWIIIAIVGVYLIGSLGLQTQPQEGSTLSEWQGYIVSVLAGITGIVSLILGKQVYDIVRSKKVKKVQSSQQESLEGKLDSIEKLNLTTVQKTIQQANMLQFLVSQIQSLEIEQTQSREDKDVLLGRIDLLMKTNLELNDALKDQKAISEKREEELLQKINELQVKIDELTQKVFDLQAINNKSA